MTRHLTPAELAERIGLSPETLRERLAEIIVKCVMEGRPLEDAVDAILREFRLQPVAVGKVTGEGEVEGL